jgi:hypothetical protein
MWETINKIKDKLKNSIIVMTGYHSMRKPEETLNNSKTDIVILSNHVDFALDKLVKDLKASNFSINKLSCDGIAYKNNNSEIINRSFKKIENINNSEIIDRDLIQWKNYAYENGNFLQTPGTYATSVIRDCTFGKCTFCRYNGPELSFSIMNVQKSINEYENLINKYNVKEIFDDSGVWYRGNDARNFAREIISSDSHAISSEVKSVWYESLKMQMSDAEITTVAELCHIPSTLKKVLELKIGDVLYAELPHIINLKVEGLPVIECTYGQKDNRLCIQVEKIIHNFDSFTHLT